MKRRMVYEINITGRLPGMNEFISAQRTNKYKGAQMKADGQHTCEIYVKKALRNVHIEKPIKIHYCFYERNTKRDMDNISGFAHKVFQDALVSCGVIDNDGWKNIVGFTDSFFVDKKNPRIEIVLEEVT